MKLYIIQEHRSYQYFDDYDIIFISKSEEKANNMLSKLEQSAKIVNDAEEDIDYVLSYNMHCFEDEFNVYDL